MPYSAMTEEQGDQIIRLIEELIRETRGMRSEIEDIKKNVLWDVKQNVDHIEFQIRTASK